MGQIGVLMIVLSRVVVEHVKANDRSQVNEGFTLLDGGRLVALGLLIIGMTAILQAVVQSVLQQQWSKTCARVIGRVA